MYTISPYSVSYAKNAKKRKKNKMFIVFYTENYTFSEKNINI